MKKFIELVDSVDKPELIIDKELLEAAQRLGLGTDNMSLIGASLSANPDIVESLVDISFFDKRISKSCRDKLVSDLNIDVHYSINNQILRKKQEVCDYLGLNNVARDQDVTKKVNVDSTCMPKYPLFPHQIKALNKIKEMLDLGRPRVILHMPTGGGKTRTAMNLVCDHVRASEGGVALWLASNKELLDQACSEFKIAWGYLGNREVDIKEAWDGNSWEINEFSDGILIASLPTLYQFMKRANTKDFAKFSDNISLIVFDEAHQAVADTYREVVEKISLTSKKITPIIGLTATPGRTYLGSDKDDELAEFFEHKKVMLDTSESGGPSNPVEYLIENGYLARPKFEQIGLDAYEVKNDTKKIDEDEEYKNLIDHYVDLVVKKVISFSQEGHKRIIVFAASVELVVLITKILRLAGINARAIYSGVDKSVREGVVSEYKSRSNDVRVLVNFGVLTTGFDAPQTSAAIIARPTKSLSLYSQMVGRAIRGPRAGGNERASIATVVDPSEPAFGEISEAFTHWNTYWD